jgi:hypothetical protein
MPGHHNQRFDLRLLAGLVVGLVVFQNSPSDNLGNAQRVK